MNFYIGSTQVANNAGNTFFSQLIVTGNTLVTNVVFSGNTTSNSPYIINISLAANTLTIVRRAS